MLRPVLVSALKRQEITLKDELLGARVRTNEG
jgi:hypothetical protein